MHYATLRSTRFAIPSTWDELTGTQLRQVAWLSRLPHSGAALAKLFFLTLTEHLPWWQRFQIRWFYIVSSSLTEKATLLYLVESFRRELPLTAQKIPQIRLKTKKIGYSFVLLHGPASQLSNATFWEYIQAEKYYLNYLEVSSLRGGTTKQSPNHETASPRSSSRSDGSDYLDRLVATLYRQAKEQFDPHADRDIRIPLTDQGMKWRMHLVARLDHHTKFAILMWFEGCRIHIQRAFPKIFQKPDPDAKKPDPDARLSARERSGQHWIELVSELAGGMDRYDAIGNTPVWTAFTDITHRIVKNEKAQQELARSRAKTKSR